MKRSILSLLALCSALTAWSQPNFLETGKSLEDVCTVKDKALVTAGADINKDGIGDLVIAIPAIYDDFNFAFYFGQAGGGYKAFRSYALHLPGELGVTVTDKGVVRIQCDRDDGSDVFLFRYENGDFRLIGGKEDRHKSNHYDVSYNYLTGKLIRTDGEGKSRKSSNGDLPALPVIRFGWLPLNYDMLDYLAEEPEDGPMSADDILVMGIFRRMQDEEMLFWHFCDWENPYRDPRPDSEDGGWYAEDDHMSPGSYNAWSTLTIDKLADGEYQLDVTESYYDRSYESLFNEDMSNIDEIMEEYETEEEVSSFRWLFRNGRFIPQEVPQPVTGQTEEIVQTFRKVPLPADCQGVAFDAYRQMMLATAEGYEEADKEAFLSESAPEGSTISYTEDTDDIEGYYESRTMDCLPLLDGGWLAIYRWAGGADSEPTGYYNHVYTLIDGKLTPAEDILPVPKDLDVFLNPEACEGREELVAQLKAAYAERPEDFLVYRCDSAEQTLTIEYRPCDPYDEQYVKHVWTDDCWELRKPYTDFPVYKWDGKRFVK